MDYIDSRRSLLEKNGFALSRTYGSSMRPLIWGGAHCVAVAPLQGEPQAGDLLMFRQALPSGKSINIVHRLVGIRQEGGQSIYITRGDNCLDCEHVYRSAIIGRVAEVHRTSGYRPWHIIPSRQFTVTDRAYLRYSRLWAATWPLRRQYYLMRAHVNALRIRLTSLFKKR